MLETLRAELLFRCFNRDDALAFVRSGLASISVADVPISTDADGMKVVPRDEAEAARWRDHVANGCFVLPGVATWDEDGVRTIYLWGE